MLPHIDENTLNPKQMDTFHAAIEGNFLIPDDFDELLDYGTKRNVQKFGMDALGLTIAPTLACNFKCVYCYETSKPGFMTVDTQSNIIRFVETQAKHLKHFDVTWYGGEPLLATDVIVALSKRFQEICVQNGLEYGAFMISNGSLINDDTIQTMKDCNIRGIQITVDGPKHIHDSRRICKTGESTFELIVNNINLLLANSIEVVLRINVDKSNEQEIESLVLYLDHKLISKNIRITFGQVTAYTEACRSIEGSCYNNVEFARRIVNFYYLLEKYGFEKANPFPYPEAKLNYCCAELLNSFVIDHEGYLYKCWNLVGDIENAVGNINEPTFDSSGYKSGRWLSRNPLESDKCRECSLLPLCVGGCPYVTEVKKESCECDLIKYNIEDVMLAYYHYAKEGLL